MMKSHLRRMHRKSSVIGAIAVSISFAAITQLAIKNIAFADEKKKDSTFSQKMPELDGKNLKVTLVVVNYGPGEVDAPHTHPCAVIGHVARGAIRSQVQGDVEHVYHEGESFYEPPNGVHLVSGSASKKDPAVLLAYFLCDHDAPLTSDVHQHGSQSK
jgi:quercetin dioxygenase-like cupin family protein